jgi:LysM repeat protein
LYIIFHIIQEDFDMKRFLTVLLIVVFSLGLMVFTGCGGSGQKVSSVSEEEGQVMDEASQKKKEELPTTYLVEKGDTLYSIAEKAEIYGNKYQWPLIFDANRDILDNYKTIAEGQKLIIPRNVSAVEIEAAKQRANELGWPPSEKANAGSAKGREEEEGTGEAVAGMGTGKVSATAAKTGSTTGETSMGAAGNTEEQPTPIPEPSKSRKKGGMNMMALLVILLGVVAVIIFFVMSQKKKKDEDEEEKEDKSDNILS